MIWAHCDWFTSKHKCLNYPSLKLEEISGHNVDRSGVGHTDRSVSLSVDATTSVQFSMGKITQKTHAQLGGAGTLAGGFVNYFAFNNIAGASVSRVSTSLTCHSVIAFCSDLTPPRSMFRTGILTL